MVTKVKDRPYFFLSSVLVAYLPDTSNCLWVALLWWQRSRDDPWPLLPSLLPLIVCLSIFCNCFFLYLFLSFFFCIASYLTRSAGRVSSQRSDWFNRNRSSMVDAKSIYGTGSSSAHAYYVTKSGPAQPIRLVRFWPDQYLWEKGGVTTSVLTLWCMRKRRRIYTYRFRPTSTHTRVNWVFALDHWVGVVVSIKLGLTKENVLPPGLKMAYYIHSVYITCWKKWRLGEVNIF